MLVQMGDLPTPDNGILSQTLWNGQGKPPPSASSNKTTTGAINEVAAAANAGAVKIKQERLSSGNLASKEKSHIASNLQVFGNHNSMMSSYDSGSSSMQQQTSNRASAHENEANQAGSRMLTNPGP
jgi:hypothetical protein